MLLGLENLEQVAASGQGKIDAVNPTEQVNRSTKSWTDRRSFPADLPPIEMVIDIEDHASPCCGKALHRIGEARVSGLICTDAAPCVGCPPT